MTEESRPEIYRLSEFGEIGVVPLKMHAWVLRSGEFGDPVVAYKQDVVSVPDIGDDEVLVRVMAVGVNYNSVWAALAQPIDVFRLHDQDYHVAGSDASGIVWKVGKNVKNCKVGDEVLVTCQKQSQEHGMGSEDNPNFTSFDPMSSPKQSIMGYETPDGTYAQFVRAQAQQILPKPKHLSWEEAASYVLTYFTAYRMLITRGELKAGELVLIWGGAGGLGCYAIQICREMGADCIAIVSSEEKGELCKKLGAMDYINRKDFSGYEYVAPEYAHGDSDDIIARRHKMTKALGKKIWDICGEKRSPDLVFEHTGMETFSASVFLAARFGRILICGATTGYDLTFDVRHLWMHQKRIIGSHYANFRDCRQANTLIDRKKIQVVNTRTYNYDELPQAHQDLYENKVVGNASILVFPENIKGLKSMKDIKRTFG